MGDNDRSAPGTVGMAPSAASRPKTQAGPLQIGGVTATPDRVLTANAPATPAGPPPWMQALIGNRAAPPPAVPPPPPANSFLRPPVALASSPQARRTALPSNLSSLLGSAGFHSGPKAPPQSDSEWIKQLFPGS